MARKRAPEHDYICRKCLCPCDPWPGGKHLGGGQGMRACKGPIDPILRAEHDAEVAAAIAAMRARLTTGR